MSEFNIKKQIRALYASAMIGNLTVTGAWVVLLSVRGFSLWQIGIAETVFHITSLIFEIPSGLMADLYGRKKTLLLSSLSAFVASLVMVFSVNLSQVCLSIAIHALSYNFASGSGDALAYDSLKKVGQEGTYEKYASNQSVLYRITGGISTLCAGLALLMGYKAAYLLSALSHVIAFLVTLLLLEVETGAEPEEQKNGFFRGLVRYFADSLGFLKEHPKATALMFLNSFVGAVDILLLFFLQSKLKTAGLSDMLLGPALFFMELGGVVGSRLILKAEKCKYVQVFVICCIGVFSGVLLEHTGAALFMVAGGFISAMADDAIQIRSDRKLQDMFPSEQRATLISISSFTFSVIMILLSPLAGWFFERW
ncbi:MAG: MFS transporter [Lachnospiraceae bacterium]|nr:MFS transporter [Lachnospiraceae bacterium]